MKQPIPRNRTEPFKVGDRIQIVPEWQDPGDEKYERIVIEAADDCTRVRIDGQPVIVGANTYIKPALTGTDVRRALPLASSKECGRANGMGHSSIVTF